MSTQSSFLTDKASSLKVCDDGGHRPVRRYINFTAAGVGLYLLTVKLIKKKIYKKKRLEAVPVSVKTGLEADDTGCCDHIIMEAGLVCHNSLREKFQS